MGKLVEVPEEVIETMLTMERCNMKKKRIDVTYKEARAELEKALEKAKKDRFEYDDGEDEILVGKRFQSSPKITYDIKKVKALLPKEVFRTLIVASIDINKLESLTKVGIISEEELSSCITSSKPGSWTIMVDRQKRGE